MGLALLIGSGVLLAGAVLVKRYLPVDRPHVQVESTESAGARRCRAGGRVEADVTSSVTTGSRRSSCTCSLLTRARTRTRPSDMPFLAFTTLRAIWSLRHDPQFAALSRLAVIAIAGGTGFYSLVEGLRLVDAFYFSVMTLTTVGYGDFAPKSGVGKLFTAVYALVGVGILLAFVTTVAAKMSQTPLLPRVRPHRRALPD